MKQRLTKRVGDGVRYDNGEHIITCYPKNNNLNPVDEMAVKLCELEDKIENGTLKELPCKVGDTVYMPWEYNGEKGIACLTVTSIFIDCFRTVVNTDFTTDDDKYYFKYNGGTFDIVDFGEKVFCNYVEAIQTKDLRAPKKGGAE